MTAPATRPHLVILEDLRAAEIPADLAVSIEQAAGRHGVPAAAIARRASARGRPAVLGELEARAAWAQNAFTTTGNLKVPLERWVVLMNEHDKYAAIYLTRLSGEDRDRQVHFVYVILDGFS